MIGVMSHRSSSPKEIIMAKKWRVGILGLGHWYSGYGLARALPEYPRAELVAVACPDEAKLREFSTTFHLDAYTDYQALLARDDIDIVHIAPPVAEIPQCCIGAAQAGKHMILGKPMAMTVPQAAAMVAAVQKAGVQCVCFQGLARLGMMSIKKRIEAGLIGDIVVMHSSGRWSIAEDWFHSGQAGWFVDPAQVPGGALIDEGIYAVELMRWLAGSEVVQVEARIANLVHKELAVEDWGMATYTFANGIIATQEASWTINAPRKTGPSPKINSNRRTEIVGTRGEIVQDNLRAPELAILAAGAEGWVFERPGGDWVTPAVPAHLNYLIQCLETGQPSIAPIEEAYKTFVISMAAYEAARTGRPVKLSW
jgi:predicted dehydrogenase